MSSEFKQLIILCGRGPCSHTSAGSLSFRKWAGVNICLSPAQHFVLGSGMDCMNVVTVIAWFMWVYTCNHFLHVFCQ